MRFGAYHRVSQVGQRDTESSSYITETEAFEQIEAWARMRKVEIVGQYLDRDVKGNRMQRPAFDQLMEDLRAGKLEGVVVAYVDRFSRADVGDALAVVKEIHEAGGQLAALDLGLDPTTEMGEFGLTILLGLARMQWRRYRQRWADTRERATRNGKFIGPTPFGYKRGASGVLEPGEHAQTIRETYRRAAEGIGTATEYLKAQAPERTWSSPDVRRMLRQRVYLGETYSGDLVNTEAHEALVSRQEWEAAQSGPKAKRAARLFPLSGLATCADCGEPLVGSRAGDGYRTYKCNNAARRHRQATCNAPASIVAERLEGHCRDGLKAIYTGEGWMSSSEPPADLSDAQRALEEAEEELRAFASDLTMRKVLGSDYHAQLQIRVDARDEALRAYREVSKQQIKLEHVKPEELFETEDPQKLRRLVDAAFDSIVVRQGRTTVEKRVILFPYGSDKPLLLTQNGEGSGLEAVTS